MSRVDSARIASIKAEDAGLELQGSVMASRRVLPVPRRPRRRPPRPASRAVIQPGGSMRDDGSDRRRRRARHGDGVHRHAALQALTA
ncbi:MAG: hypothetical protein MZV65_37650 [Chromatiales bacterium]|nr:hypothetical protein [Chromatiales bacterium]